jgi:putative Holliday junction resolvase
MSTAINVLLGFDFGTKRIGVAVGQVITGTAQPLTTLASRNMQPDWEKITQLIEQWKPDALVVGIPLHMDGSEQELTHLAKRFGNRLSGRYNLPVYPIDERLSSYEAEQELTQTNGSFVSSDIDRISAKLILQSWLNQHNTKP